STPVSSAAGAAQRKNRSKRIAVSQEPFTAPKSSPGFAAASDRQRGDGKKEVAAPAAFFVSLSLAQVLQQLWEMTKARDRRLLQLRQARHTTIKTFSAVNDFPAISKFLKEYDRTEQNARKIPIEELVYDAIWSAVRAKSLGVPSPYILQWIEDKVIRLPEQNPEKKESMIWLLSILRDDWSLLEQLLQESYDKNRRVGPEIRREETLRHLALTYLLAGKKTEFRSLFTMPIIRGGICNAALLHHAMHRHVPKSDLVMLRWYANSLAISQTGPIEKVPHFTTVMEPMIRHLGGRIEKWTENDPRMEKLRKWRGDFNDSELDELTHSLLDFMKYLIVDKNRGTLEDLERLERMLARLKEQKRKGDETVVIDWLNLCWKSEQPHPVINLLPSYSLVVVGRESSPYGRAVRSPEESTRVKVMEVTSTRERKHEMDDICALILAVATRGYLLSNDVPKDHIKRFRLHLRLNLKDVNQATLFEKYMSNALLMWDNKKILPPVDHSRAAQWIDNEKKELAFTLARRPHFAKPRYPYRIFEYYSLHVE
ncbi:hypothetical protein PMAYCL1PPCAC_22704, partial [Pristionchus mayeri]